MCGSVIDNHIPDTIQNSDKIQIKKGGNPIFAKI